MKLFIVFILSTESLHQRRRTACGFTPALLVSGAPLTVFGDPFPTFSP